MIMWPFSEMSLSTASLVGTIANWMLLASLVGGVISTFVIVKASDVKEEHWAEDRRKSNERIAELTTQGDLLRKDTAEANAKALESRLELEKFRAPRTLSLEQRARITEKMKPFAGAKFDGAWSSLEGEIDFFFSSFEDALNNAGLVSVSFTGTGNIYGRGSRSSVGMANAFGIVINVDPAKNPELVPAALEMVVALTEEGIGVVFQKNVGFTSTNADTIHIMVGAKH
jgi:hypothetical protein